MYKIYTIQTGMAGRLLPKLWLIMRLTIIIMIVSLVQVSATSLAQRITVNKTNQTLISVLRDVRMQTGYNFVITDDQAERSKPVTINVSQGELLRVLDELFRSQPLSYKIDNKTIVVSDRRTGADPVFRPTALSVAEIRGVVFDEKHEPMPGVTVRHKESGTAVSTNVKGEYQIRIPDATGTLTFSFLGYQTREIPLNNQTNLDVTLNPVASNLNEVVVIGYGTRKKEADLTGAVARINGDKLQNRPVTGTLDAMQGLIPGVAITRSSGQPGQQDFALTIRGSSSINGNVPLVLIDGVPGDLSLINPQDIQDVTVLKDATAAIYGARAADGVILVTTRRGKRSGTPTVSYGFNLAVKKVGLRKKAATTDHFVRMFNEANKNDGEKQTFSDSTLMKIAANYPGVGPGENRSVESFPMFYQNHDWYGRLFKTAYRPTHNLSISGGSENSSYLISFGDLRDNGNISEGTNKSVRDNLRIALQTNITKNLKLDLTTAYDYLNTRTPSELHDAISNGLKMFSYLPEKNPAGNYYGYQGYENPVQELIKGGDETMTNNRWSNNVKLDFEPIKGLVWTGQVGINLERRDDDANFPTNTEYNWDNTPNLLIRNNPNRATFRNASTVYKNYSTYVNYSKTFGQHDIKAMVGASQEKFTQDSRYIQGQGFFSNEIFTLPLSDNKNLRAGDARDWNRDPWALQSYFGRASYSFAGRYYLEGTLRKDGSSKFSPDKRWSAIYPSLSAAWKISEEPFFKRIFSDNTVNLFKVRASWGRTGNQDISQLGLFDYVQLINVFDQYPIDGSSAARLAALKGLSSPLRTWETIETKNLGLDVSLFASKLSLSFDLYRKTNNNMLVSITYPTTLGAVAPSSNAGTLKGKGWEFNGQWSDRIGEFRYNVGAILNYNTNIVSDLKGNDNYNLGLTQARQGYPLNSYFGFKGSIIRNQADLDAYAAKYGGKGIVPSAQPNGYGGLGIGDVMYEDIDGDGQITTYGDKSKGLSGDAVNLGSQIPKFTYSLTGGLAYKGFDLNFILQGTGNKYVWRGNGNFGVPLAHFWFQPLDYFYGRTFNADNPSAMYPRLSNNETVKNNNYQFSSLWLENTRYLRMKNITVGYTFNNIQVARLKVHSIRVYVSGQDLFEFAKGTWNGMYDPEETRVAQITDDARNTDFYENNYPMYRTISVGVNVNF
ncbi:TonB-dependent receptor [Mucilaginibacter pocheonensis]|uniref:TonB-linked SusC/RagA family outer membrane protein n=1 Tax=Mucilaginibacter pocheonensis TaxID=398050 RepID=A0ABU1T835_9SPHI|nr:TonB-dependent receptor [Mucilaginibacter pocheonensis]MDR6941568.1 TonB-linked SusC/RagA family outer membrane protein [Mucilaginibacter pocheonensis]